MDNKYLLIEKMKCHYECMLLDAYAGGNTLAPIVRNRIIMLRLMILGILRIAIYNYNQMV